MLGAILGDIIGSYYESHCVHQTDFEPFNRWSTFTDDSVLNCAIAKLLLNNLPDAILIEDMVSCLQLG